MATFNALLESFDTSLRKFNLTNYERLYAPLSDGEINDYLEQLNINDEDFKLLYKWKNGYDPDQNPQVLCQLFDFGTLVSLNYIVEALEANETIGSWEDNFIPLITDSTGQYLLFNNDRNSKDYGKLHLYSASLLFVEEPVSYHDSIASFIDTTIEAYETGALRYDAHEDWLNKDVDEFRRIGKRINVNSEYWSL
ncbi:hypothetical protein A4H97_21640 [Niastella yeongjuensis]|uniref:Knr4/Smi1-like domain-containing protein n=1 Tax=Niastella yeongjuensis TaxID=354355 RepID=A0A1V9F8D1_9BACT|nr:SMI1/KNR4 family protein [Niastella yeongjuensis]OQP54575.1 hypothetical protein A4H97_21640 [Niastella yeongjuensis]SEN99424.1 hypothetical protein SAMN05660816_01841 [Niastella yeongjuensis]